MQMQKLLHFDAFDIGHPSPIDFARRCNSRGARWEKLTARYSASGC